MDLIVHTMLPEWQMSGHPAWAKEKIGPDEEDSSWRIQGNALISGPDIVYEEHEVTDVKYLRVAQRLYVNTNGLRLWVVTTHLTHLSRDADKRAEQMKIILDWMSKAREADFVIIMGDFNSVPQEPLHDLLRKAGFTSVYALANGKEPDYTFPSGLVAPGQDWDTDPICVDFIYCRSLSPKASFTCKNAFVAGNQREPNVEPPLYPSDHIFVVADVIFSKVK